MGKAFSAIQRRANRFNVENRAQKVISKEKPEPAPLHPATAQEIEAIKSEYPHALEEQLKKDPALDTRLKKVFVQSQDPEVEEGQPQRSLPQDRKQPEDFEFGHKEPKMITQGRFTLKQAVKFISDHQTDPATWSAAAIAKEYKLDQEKLENVLHYFRTFRIHLPSKTGEKIKVEIIEEKSQQLLGSQQQHQEQK
ncbi:hypothetical protein L9F63_021054 [Diploptera punctata]|uniref:NADH dehydrogenase [ubiquinone] 1 alpha subcomplex assembly factor 4 n=1 Tax=Diploptera punctata TaxID=6984 RepID=A0AAD7ZR45_DIPPU|nr:hypothetical protein L9F63_021054 [Diploptera punctata]